MGMACFDTSECTMRNGVMCPILVEGLLHHSIPHWCMWLGYAVFGYLPLWRLARRVRISAFFLAAPEPC